MLLLFVTVMCYCYVLLNSEPSEPIPEPDEYIIEIHDIGTGDDYAEYSNLTYEEIKSILSLVADKDLSTVALLDDVTYWFYLEIDENYEHWLVGSIRLHLMFFEDWFSCPTHPCLASVDDYEVKVVILFLRL